MNKMLFAGTTLAAFAAAAAPVMAADMPVKAAPVVDVWSWAGYYVGANGGYSWGRAPTDVSFLTPATGAPIAAAAGSILSGRAKLTGGIAGGQGGYNWQFGNIVVGLEGDLEWSSESGNSRFLCGATATGGVCLPGTTALPAGATGTALTMRHELDWFGSARARFGMAVTPSFLAYATGGLAVGHVKTSATLAGFTPAGAATSVVFLNDQTNAGWVAGAGVEARIANTSWTWKAEYLYMDLGRFNNAVNFTTATPAIGARFNSRVSDNIARVGLNYKFGGPAAVVARY